jgi:hypothetical protein
MYYWAVVSPSRPMRAQGCQVCDEAALASCAGTHAAATARLRRFGRKRSSIRRDASRSKSFSPQSGQISSSKSTIVAFLFRTEVVSVTFCLRSRLLPQLGHVRIAIAYPSTAFFEEIKM